MTHHALRAGMTRRWSTDVRRPESLADVFREGEEPVDILAESLGEFHPKDALQTEQMADLDGIVKDAVGLKFLDAPMTRVVLAEFLQIPPTSELNCAIVRRVDRADRSQRGRLGRLDVRALSNRQPALAQDGAAGHRSARP